MLRTKPTTPCFNGGKNSELDPYLHFQNTTQRDKGNTHQAAVRALAFKWIRILYRCWQDRTPYDASVYLQALNRRGSSLIHNLAEAS